MTKKSKHISEEDFQRYLKNQMTDAERNAFERVLQKHPFEAEALEGFQQISPEELSRDLRDLKSGLFSEKQKNRFRYWAAVATFLLLITSGVIWFQLKDETPIPAITENKAVVNEDTVIKSQIIPIQKSTVENDIIPVTRENAKVKAPEAEIKSVVKEEVASNKSESRSAKTLLAPQNKSLAFDENLAQQNIQEINARSEKRIADMKFQDDIGIQNNTADITLLENSARQVEVKKIADNEWVFLSGNQNNFVKASVIGEGEKSFDTARLREPGFAQMEFNTAIQPADTNRIVSSFQELSNSGQIVIRGLGKPEVNEMVSSAVKVESNVNVSPKGGIEEFEKYLEEKAVLPADYKKNHVVIKMLVTFDQFGNITGFTNENKADSVVFERAKKIIEEGPKWSPKIQNSRPVSSETELKIDFRKKK